jgi:hypothetical protein
VDGSKDATSNQVAFDLAEPQLDLVEPGRVGRGEVEVDPRVVFKELADQAGLVSREVVEDDVNLLSGRTLGNDFFEKGNKVLAGVAGRGFAVHVAGSRFQSGIQGQCSMAVVLETVALDPSWGKRQDGIEPIQGLNHRRRKLRRQLWSQNRDRRWPCNIPGRLARGSQNPRPQSGHQQ